MPVTSTEYNYFPIMFGFAAVLVAIVLVVVILAIVRNRRRPEQSTEQRLRDLDDLRGRALISPEEYVKARSQVLTRR